MAILLHEIGHMILREGRSLLPDDGDDSDLSRANTRRVIAICRPEIKALNQVSFEQRLAKLRAQSNSELAKTEPSP